MQGLVFGKHLIICSRTSPPIYEEACIKSSLLQGTVTIAESNIIEQNKTIFEGTQEKPRQSGFEGLMS